MCPDVARVFALFQSVCALVMLLPWLVGAAEPLPRFEDVGLVDWDYAPQPTLALFRIYLSQQSGQYRLDRANPCASKPDLVIPAIPSLVSEVLSSRLHPSTPGTWYLVVTAVSKEVCDLRVPAEDRESPPSEELAFTVGTTTDPTPPPVPPWTPPWGTDPWMPPQPIAPLPPMPPLPTPAPKGDGGPLLSESCLWSGRNCP